jgi:uroporphyrinogen decarboxylase
MLPRDLISNIFAGCSSYRAGFWLGNPANETKQLYYEQLGIRADVDMDARPDTVLKTGRRTVLDIQLHEHFKSDIFWACPHHDRSYYLHPEGRPVFDIFGGKPRESLTQPGVFAECETVSEVDAFDWPDPAFLDLSDTIDYINTMHERGKYIFSGAWSPFFHDLCDFFGMENYFLKMFTHPAVVEAVTERVLEFYLAVNSKLFEAVHEKVDAVFFGNDLGSQFNALIGINEFRTFVLPGIRKIAGQAKQYNLKVVLHSCGSVFDLIPYFIEAGIDGLHPLQAKASNMDAETLSGEFKRDLVFIGGVDTQDLLPFGKPHKIKEEIDRLMEIFGPRFIVSPSHEALLPNVSLENALAMRDAVFEKE